MLLLLVLISFCSGVLGGSGELFFVGVGNLCTYARDFLGCFFNIFFNYLIIYLPVLVFSRFNPFLCVSFLELDMLIVRVFFLHSLDPHCLAFSNFLF